MAETGADLGGRRFPWGRAVAGAALLTALVLAGKSAVWTVAQNEQGIVLRFGRFSRSVGPGIHLKLPWPAERVHRVATTEVRTMPIGYRLIDSVQGRAPSAAESQWLTGDTNVVEVAATLLYTVDDPVEYLVGCSDLSDGRSKDFVLRKACESVLTATLAAMPVDEALSGGKTELVRRAQGQIQELCNSLRLGLTVRSINIASIQPPQEVIGAFNDLTTARAERARRITEAEGHRASALPRARAAANTSLRAAEIESSELLARARGAASAFAQLAEEVAKDPALARQRIWLTAIERILEKVSIRILPPPEEGDKRRVYYER